MAIPLIMGLVFCTFLWVFVLFQSQSEGRTAILRQQERTRAYYMLLAGYQHLFLKLKEQPRFIERVLTEKDPARQTRYLKDFSEDISLEIKFSRGYHGSYKVKKLLLKSVNENSAANQDFALDVSIEAQVGRLRDVQNKLIRIRRH